MSDQIDVATHGPDGHWDYADIVRLCAHRDEMAQQLAAITAGVCQWQINALQAMEEADALTGQLAAEREEREKIAAERDVCEDLAGQADARTAVAEARRLYAHKAQIEAYHLAVRERGEVELRAIIAESRLAQATEVLKEIAAMGNKTLIGGGRYDEGANDAFVACAGLAAAFLATGGPSRGSDSK